MQDWGSGSWLALRARTCGGRVAYRFHGTDWTYDQARRRAAGWPGRCVSSACGAGTGWPTVADAGWGELPRSVEVPVPGPAPDPAELVAFLRGRLVGYNVPKSVIFADELLRTATGKIREADLHIA